ncbi:MAG: hypothetical protein H0W50_03805 [Parachlamydiaceae bacterium]|nr:hypothetical protein [Parachlamydiaceae bacterium]
MNIDELVNWADKTLMILDLQECLQKKTVAVLIKNKLATGKCDMTVPLNDDDYKEFLEDFGWLKDMEADIRMFSEYALIGVRNEVRTQGLHTGSYEELDKKLNDLPLKCKESYQLCGECLDFIEQQTEGLKEGDLLLGSDEVIEALFGTTKKLVNEDAKHGLTSFVLAAPASCGELDEVTIMNAFCAIKDKHVNEWSQLNLGRTHLSKRRRCYKVAKNLMTKAKEMASFFRRMEQKVAGSFGGESKVA